jgi:cobalamin synthase
MQAWPRLADLGAALGILTALPFPRPDSHSIGFARAALLFPAVGLAVGIALAAFDRLVISHLPPYLGGVALVGCWEALARFPARRAWRTTSPGGARAGHGQDPRASRRHWTTPVMVAVLLVLLMIKVVCLAVQSLARPAALVFAPTLGCWAMVVLATGARDAAAPGRKFNPGVAFREFALTSVFTFAVCFALAEFTGVLLVVGAAALTLLLRLLLHGWWGGVSDTSLRLGAEAVETLVLVLLAITSRHA